MFDPDPEVWLEEDGILRIQCPQNFDLTLAAAQSIFETGLTVANSSSPVLVYADTLVSAEYEAQRFVSESAVVEVVSGMAILARTFFARALVDLFMRFHVPPYPTRVFQDEQVALGWLAQFIRQENGASTGTGDTGG
jgi:hypothetical protein